MQVSKTYTGTVTLEDKTEKREYSYGQASTITCYPSKIDTLNSIVAQFLYEECGVDARYGVGKRSDYSFLWIYGVPFLLGMTGANNQLYFYQPFGGGSSQKSNYASTNTATDISLFSGARYSFGLVFAGNPNTGFCLRFKQYNSTAVTNVLILRFMKSENLINGADSVLWSAINHDATTQGSTTATATNLFTGFRAIDVAGNEPIEESYSGNTSMNYSCLLQSLSAHRNYNEGALPLVPLTIGPYRANGIYLRPRGFGLPSTHTLTTEVQAEVTIGDRSFLIASSDTMSYNTMNMGLIETT